MSLSQSSKDALGSDKSTGWGEGVKDDASSHGAIESSENPDGSSTNNDSTTDNGSSRTGTTDEDIQTIKDALAKRESQQVFRLRLIVVLVLFAAAASVSVTVYLITRNAELEEFETEYKAVSQKILDALEAIIVDLSAVSGLAVMATSEARNRTTSGTSWPFVKLDDFLEKATNARSLSGALYVSINPIVESEDLIAWEKYVLSHANTWISDGLAVQDRMGINDFVDQNDVDKTWLTDEVVDPLHTFDSTGNPLFSMASGPYLPRWQTSPVLAESMVNENLFEKHHVEKIVRDCIATKSAVLGGFHSAPTGTTSSGDHTTSFFATLLSMWEGEEIAYLGDPMTHLAIPIFDSLDKNNRKVAAVLKATIQWKWFLRNVLPETDYGLNVVIENACDGNFTYLLNGPEAVPVEFGDLHDRTFSKYQAEGKFQTDRIEDGTFEGLSLNQNACPYTFRVYPAQEDYDHYVTNQPVVISSAIAGVFLFTICMFFVYDRLVERRQKLVLAKATQSTAIVSSLFPKQVRDRLMAMESEKKKGAALVPANHKLKSFLNGGDMQAGDAEQTIADFFPNCTVFFADIAGFTAWSSTREPAQVFILLQSVYQAFDILAKRRKVFKVETIGDSYVAVTGLPEPQKDHAVLMARFAWDCLMRVGEITKELEVSLGPDTGDLSMRFGLHSGAVTAGVLKGDRARFQLFGDTVNTAARMESTGMKGRIQVSEATAQMLRKAGKGSWLMKRNDGVNAKGKGVLDTYWLALKSTSRSNGTGTSSEENKSTSVTTSKPSKFFGRKKDKDNREARESRLVDWMVDILSEHIKKVVIVHERCTTSGDRSDIDLFYRTPNGKICLDEVKESIAMPKFDANVAEAALDSQAIKIPHDMVNLLREYVTLIARSYRDNPFHNFEHACHVTMSVSKLLRRIVTPDLAHPDLSESRVGGDDKKTRNEKAAEIHNFTHGLTSDPMASFAIVFSALIHDVDHQGISNVQLIKEEPGMGAMYRNKSVAEQNSLDVAWDILMTDRFGALRKYVFGNRSELMRFRQLIVNVVLATDIFDKEIGARRKDRWERAFHGDGSLSGDALNNVRATIVMEHIIQASDVSHTMQHWHVYQKWNSKLFKELYRAWVDGRMGSDPSHFWYQGELGFFDNYVIPLAKKLKECNVFGVSSDEYLGYAERNRAEWEERGQDILKSLINEVTITNGTTETVEETDSSLASSLSKSPNGDKDIV